MTDAPSGAAPAAPEQAAVPIEAPVTPPNPIESSGPEKQPEAVIEKPSASVKDAIVKAEAKLKEADKAKDAPKVEPKAKVEPKEEPKAEARQRDETGKFAPKQPAEAAEKPQDSPEAKQAPEQPKAETRFREAPKRFSDDAKQVWETAPEPVKAEVHRAVKELEEGIGKYREVVEPLKPYLQLAQQHNTTIDKALGQYISLEQALRSPQQSQKNAALNDVFQTAGINPREWAAQLLNQTPDQVTSQQDATISELRQELASLKQQVGGVTQTFQQQRETATLQEVTKFAEAPEHSRFEELADDIAFFMKSGRAAGLSEAYELAERLNPAPVKAAAPPPVIPAIVPDADAHTKGSKSISGAPSPGSSPSAKKSPSPSIRDALKRAIAQAS